MVLPARASHILGCFLVIAPLFIYAEHPLPVISPDKEEMVVKINDSFSITCTGEYELSWQYPTKDSMDDGEDSTEIRSEENNSGLFVSVLEVKNASFYHTGTYTCYYNHTQADESEVDGTDIYIYVPDPLMPFAPSSMLEHFIVVEEDDYATVPCRTTNPNTQVTLRNSEQNKTIHALYDSKSGFTGKLPSGSYICETTVNGLLFRSEDYVLQTWKANDIVVEMQAPKTVFISGETITISCVVLENEMVNQEWHYPGEQRRAGFSKLFETKKPLKLEYLLTVPNATEKDSGEYECEVINLTENSIEAKKVHVTVHDKGFVDLNPKFGLLEYANLHEVKSFSVEVHAYPAPKMFWLKDNSTLNNNLTEITPIITVVKEARYLSTLKLIRVKEEDNGVYTLVVQNDAETKMFSFELQIKEALINHGALSNQSGMQSEVDLPPTIEDPDGVPLTTTHTDNAEASTLVTHPRRHEDRLELLYKKKLILKRLKKTEDDVRELKQKIQKLQHIEQLTKKLEENVQSFRSALLNL